MAAIDERGDDEARGRKWFWIGIVIAAGVLIDMLLRLRRRIWTLAALAALFATPALYLGLVYFRG